MKYIESKLSADGTYDHSEVKTAYENGRALNFGYPKRDNGFYGVTQIGQDSSTGRIWINR